MAKKSRQAAPAQPGAGPTALAKARFMLEAGDVRRARAFATEAAESGPEAERIEARNLLDRIRPDRLSMLAVAGVLLLIVIAAWAALLRH